MTKRASGNPTTGVWVLGWARAKAIVSVPSR